jgi:hypothetical protein
MAVPLYAVVFSFHSDSFVQTSSKSEPEYIQSIGKMSDLFRLAIVNGYKKYNGSGGTASYKADIDQLDVFGAKVEGDYIYFNIYIPWKPIVEGSEHVQQVVELFIPSKPIGVDRRKDEHYRPVSFVRSNGSFPLGACC